MITTLLQESSRGRRRRGWRLSATLRPVSTPRATSGRGAVGRATVPTPDRTAAGPTAGFRPGYSPATPLASASRSSHTTQRRRRESSWRTALRLAGQFSRDSDRELVEQNNYSGEQSERINVVDVWVEETHFRGLWLRFQEGRSFESWNWNGICQRYYFYISQNYTFLGLSTQI